MKKFEQIEKAKNKLMFLKTQNNLKDIVYINAILEEYQRNLYDYRGFKMNIPPHSCEIVEVNFNIWHLFKNYLTEIHGINEELLTEFEDRLFDNTPDLNSRSSDEDSLNKDCVKLGF